MSPEKIESLVESHQMWLLHLRTLIEDVNVIGRISHDHIDDHTQCELSYLLKTQAISYSTPFMVDLLQHIHASFHGVAALLVDLRNRNASMEEMGEYVTVMEQLSEQLIALLRKATH